MKELEEIFDTPEFKSASKYKQIWIRIQVAFFQSISYF